MMKDDDFKLLRGFADRRTDGRTNEQTFVIVESLSRLKTAYFMTSGKKVGGPLTKTKFQKKIEIWTNSHRR